ncbi:MAG: response regulator transcription factor [Clostridiales bacterium]|jgi:DNA-binding LytR/AlgR family response regulator|nr:response regulator transcription factor [Clostridiales bacterium]
MKYIIGVCDDEKLQVKVNGLYIKEIALRNNWDVAMVPFNTGRAVLEYLATRKLDVLFLDIDLGNESGIGIAEKIAVKYPEVVVIFITGHREFANDAFDVDAMGYIVKPVEEKKMERVLKKTLTHVEAIRSKKPSETIVVTVENLKKKILQNDILYIERQQAKSIIVLKGKKYGVYETITSLAERLTDSFLRISQSYIVNKSFIAGIEGNRVLLKNGMDISIGRTYRKDVLEAYYQDK